MLIFNNGVWFALLRLSPVFVMNGAFFDIFLAEKAQLVLIKRIMGETVNFNRFNRVINSTITNFSHR